MPAKERTLAQGNAVTTAQTATAARIARLETNFPASGCLVLRSENVRSSLIMA